MASLGTVQYKFKSQTAVHTVQFEGASIRLAELKAEIIRTCGINKDIWSKTDLEISNAQTGDVFGADAQVDRNVAVLVRRVPAQRRAPIKSQVLQRELSVEDDDVGSGASAYRAPAPVSTSAAAVEAIAASETKVAARTAGRYASKLICPLTGTIFEDAVITTCCGTSFSQEPLARTLKMRGACPECNTEAARVRTLPNRLLREAVAAAKRASEGSAAAQAAAAAAPPKPPGDATGAGVGPAVAVKTESGGSAAGVNAERKRPLEAAGMGGMGVKVEGGHAARRQRPSG
jgi:hypothetical protein